MDIHQSIQLKLNAYPLRTINDDEQKCHTERLDGSDLLS
jgi:hypothetical protein